MELVKIIQELESCKTSLVKLKTNILHHQSINSGVVNELLERQQEYECKYTRHIEELRRQKEFHLLKDYLAWYGGYLGIAFDRKR